MQYQRGDVDFEKYNGSIRWISDMEETKAKAETAVYLAKANLEEILGMNLEDVKQMDLVQFLKVLAKKKMILIIVPITALIATFFLTKNNVFW